MDMVKQNTAYLSLLSVLSAISVVFLHTNGCFWRFSTARYWITANVIECVFYFAVPVFFMISGATLMDYRERYSTKEYFKKRLLKTAVPFVFWSLVGLALNVVVYRTTPLSAVTPAYLLDGLLNTRFVQVYWFFIPLFLVYAAMPLFSAVPRERRRTLLTYLAVVGFVLNSLIPFVLTIFKVPISYSVRFDATRSYLIYPVIGYLLYAYEMPKWGRYVIYVLGAAGLLAHIIGTYHLSMAAGSVVDTYKGYMNIPSLFHAVAVFLLFKSVGNRLMQGAIGKIVDFLKNYTFPVYLLHMLILPPIVRLLNIPTESIFYRLGAPFVVIPVCVGMAYLLRKIPFVKHILP